MKQLKNYDKACIEIAKEFWNKYFKEDEEDIFEFNYPHNVYAIGGQLDGIWQVNDYYFNIQDFVIALRYNATWDQLTEWYYGVIERGKTQNLENYLKYNWIETKETLK